MAIPQLTEEQIRTWSLEQKDRWWLATVFRGDMAQLTFRSAITGFLLGGILSATNLYVGAKTGWTLGVGLTSVILAFAMFKVLSRLGAKDMTILENNCMQSVATAAGYMTGPLISGMTAYMWVQDKLLPWHQMLLFNVVLSILGVLVAFPMKRRFINDEQQPFPEGRAAGVVLDTLYTSHASVGLFKAKVLAFFALGAGFVSFISGEAYLKAIRASWLWTSAGGKWKEFVTANKEVLDRTWHLPHELDKWISWMYARVWVGAPAWMQKPSLNGTSLNQLGLRPSLDLAMFGAGGLMGIRSGVSMLIGMLLNFCVIVPWMIAIGQIQAQKTAEGVIKLTSDGDPLFGRTHILNTWALWYGIVMMVVAAMVALFAKPQIFTDAIGGLFRKGTKAPIDPAMKKIEFPLMVSWIGIPVVGAIGVWMASAWFGVRWDFGALAIPMIVGLTLIAASSTAMTGITPTGSLSKIPQFIFGAADPKHPPTNLMTGVMCVEVASNASNLLMDIKPGYMLGAKPRQQAIGHIIGIIAGSLASTPLFYLLFLSDYKEGDNIQAAMTPDGGQFSFPSAVQWKGVSELVTSIFGGSTAKTLLTPSIITSMVIAGVVALVMEIVRIRSKGKFPLSPLAIGLGVVVPPDSVMAMFAGALFFTITHHLYSKKPDSFGNKLWVATHEPICAGIIAGAALVGIGDMLVKVFLFK